MDEQASKVGPVLRRTIWRVFGLAGATAVVGVGLVRDRSRPDNLNQVTGVGAFILAAAFFSVAGVWVMRARKACWPGMTAGGGSDTGRLVVRRPLATASDLIRKYEVHLDGRTVGALRFGEFLSLPIRGGGHSLRVSFDQWSSEPVAFECGPHGRVTFDADATSGPAAVRRAVGPIVVHRV